MSRIRLELVVADADAEGLAAELGRQFCVPVQDSRYPWSSMSVSILSDEGDFEVGSTLRLGASGEFEVTRAEPLLTWTERPGDLSGVIDGKAGGIKLFELWPAVAEGDAPWSMNSFLPGYYPAGLIGPNTTSGDDLDEMKRSAEEILRRWIERVQGGARP